MAPGRKGNRERGREGREEVDYGDNHCKEAWSALKCIVLGDIDQCLSIRKKVSLVVFSYVLMGAY